MNYCGDIAIVDKLGQPTVIIEVKLKLGTDDRWAARLFHNLFDDETPIPQIQFFWLALPDRFYIWKNAWKKREHRDYIFPDYSVDATPILKPYFERTHIAPERVVDASFALLLDSWLYGLSVSEELPETLREHEEWLTESGLLEAIRNGYTMHEPTPY